MDSETPPRYKIVKPNNLSEYSPKVGEVWRLGTRYDYGIQNDDERATGKPHITLSRDGNYPQYCVPLDSVEAYAD